MASAPLHLLEGAVEEWEEVEEVVEEGEEEVVVEEEVAAVEEEAVAADKGTMATTSPKARSRPGRAPGPVRPHRATLT